MTNDINLIRTNKTILQILSKFPPIQNKEKFLYFGVGKSFFYGLKSCDFNKFSEFENGNRIFNHWRDKLVEMRLLIKIYPKKERGSPYAITPLGIAYLVQNLANDMENIQVQNCINVLMHFFKGNKTGLMFDKVPIYYHAFAKTCDLVKFTKEKIIFEISVVDDLHVKTMELKNYPQDTLKDRREFEEIAYFLIGNMCWLVWAYHVYEIPLARIRNNNFELNALVKSFDLLPKEVKIFGKIYGEKRVVPLIEAYSRLVNKIMNFNNKDKKLSKITALLK